MTIGSGVFGWLRVKVCIFPYTLKVVLTTPTLPCECDASDNSVQNSISFRHGNCDQCNFVKQRCPVVEICRFVTKISPLIVCILYFRYRYINITWLCCNGLAMSNSCYNPFIYGLFNVSIHAAFCLQIVPAGVHYPLEEDEKEEEEE